MVIKKKYGKSKYIKRRRFNKKKPKSFAARVKKVVRRMGPC